MKILNAILKFLLVFAALAVTAIGIVNPLIWQACDNCDLGIIGIAYGYYLFALIIILPLSIVFTRVLIGVEKRYCESRGLDHERTIVSFILLSLPVAAGLFYLIYRSAGWLLATSTSPDVALIAFGLVGLLFVIGISQPPLQFMPGFGKPTVKLRLGHALMLLSALIAGSLLLFQFKQTKPLALPDFIPETLPFYAGTTLPEPPTSNSIEAIVPMNYRQAVDYYKSSLPTAGWPIIASWDYSGNGSWNSDGSSGFPTKVITSDKKQTVRFTIYPDSGNTKSRVTIELNNYPCYRVVESEQCRTDDEPELVSQQNDESNNTKTFTNPAYHYQITVPDTWDKDRTVYIAQEAQWLTWNSNAIDYSESISVKYSDNFAEFLELGLNGSQNQSIGARTFKDFIFSDPDLKDVRTLTLNGNPAYAAINTWGEPNYNHLEIYIEHNGHIYTLTVSGDAPFESSLGYTSSYLGLHTSSDISQLPEEFRTIINSFTFID